jgi:salicylate hydroxylase
LIHRADYQKILYDAAIELGVHVLLGSPIEAVEESGPIVILKSGQQLSADLVVGADGIRSRTRKSILMNDDVEAVDSPNCAYRATVPADVMLSDPKVSHLMTDPNTNLWFGHERHIVAYPIRKGTIYNVFMSHPGKGSVGRWNEPGNVEEMRRHFSNWDPVIQQVLSHIEECRKWKLAYLPPLEKWVSDSGRVVLIGDAAHGMLPYMAQGAAVSIEDGAALAECIDRAESVSDLQRLLSAFEMIRKPRCEAISGSTLANADVWHLPDGPAQQARDRKLGKVDEKEAKKETGDVDKWSGKDQQRGLFGYDTVKEVRVTLSRTNSDLRS